jgi:hypothetical protein
MTNKLKNGMKNAQLNKLVNIMTLSVFLLMTGAWTANALSSASSEASELKQDKTRITGTVVDQTGVPVAGANVVEKGVTANGTTTDANGNFSLNVSSGATLAVTINNNIIMITVPVSLSKSIESSAGKAPKCRLRDVFSSPDTPAGKIRDVFSSPDTPAGKIHDVFSSPDAPAGKIHDVFGKKPCFFTELQATGILPALYS